MRSDFINRRFVYRGISAGPPPATRIVEYVFFPTGDISYWQRSTPQVGSAPGISYASDKHNNLSLFWSGPANVLSTGLGIGLLNPWNDAWNESSQSYDSILDDSSESIPARTPTRSIISYNLSAITADSEILSADLRLTVRGKRYWEGTARDDQPSSIDNHPISIKVMPGSFGTASFGPTDTYGPLAGNTMWHEYFTPQNMSSGWTGPSGILKAIPRILGSSPQMPVSHWIYVSQIYGSNPNIYFDSVFPNETRVVSGNYPGGAYLSTDSSTTPGSPNLTQGLHFKLPNTATGEANILDITDLVKWQYMKHVKPLSAPFSNRFNIVMHGKIDNPNPPGGQSQNSGYRLTGLVGGTYGEFKMIVPPYGDTANEFDPNFYKHDAVIVFNSSNDFSGPGSQTNQAMATTKITFRKSFRHEYLGFTMTNQEGYNSNFLQGMSLSNQPGGLNYFYFITDPNFNSSEIPTHLKDLVRTGFTVGNTFEFNFGYLPPPNQTITESTTAQRHASGNSPEYITCRAQTRRLVDRYDMTKSYLGEDRIFTTLVFQNESSSTTNDQGMFSNTSVSPPYYHHGVIITQTAIIPELLATYYSSPSYIIADQAKFNIRQLNPIDQGNKNLVEVETTSSGGSRFFPTPGLGYTGINLSVGSFVRFSSSSPNFQNGGAYEVTGTYDGISGDDYFNTVVLQSLALCQYVEVQRDIIPQQGPLPGTSNTINCNNVTHLPILKVRCRESVQP